jgi:hypothetical protein
MLLIAHTWLEVILGLSLRVGEYVKSDDLVDFERGLYIGLEVTN